ncbi:protein SpAN-like [Clytia hemisphaerica]|uniref:CUB domain-containing protein n=1 Tax=Clytia hemisphaerica TaxID=252671 RepID=A0A7M5UR37_9CNID
MLSFLLGSSILSLCLLGIEGACDAKTLTDVTGTFTSPGYPQNYPFGDTCQWKIKVAPNLKIKLQFPDMDILSSDSSEGACGTNRIAVVHSSDPRDPPLLYCNSHPPPIEAQEYGNELTVTFTSTKTEAKQSKGFSANYTAYDPNPPPPTTTTTTTTTTTANTTTTITPSNTTTPATSQAPVTQKPQSKLSKGVIAVICILVILVVLLIIDIILYQKDMGVIYSIRRACGGYDSVST